MAAAGSLHLSGTVRRARKVRVAALRVPLLLLVVGAEQRVEVYGQPGPEAAATLATVNEITALAGTIVNDTGSLTGSIDLSAWIGQNIRVSFELDVPNNFSGPAQFQLDNVALSGNAVPEPASLLLVGLGMAGLGFGRRKKV